VYKVVVHKRGIRKLQFSPKSYLKRFSELVDLLKLNPVPWKEFDIKKVAGAEDTYRVRIGGFRVIYYVDKIDKTVHILRFDSRSRVY
jgi:Cytotoxic translational repressor of toxin-antitoxin stability system